VSRVIAADACPSMVCTDLTFAPALIAKLADGCVNASSVPPSCGTYGTRCAVCALAHGALLNAPHIVPDGQDGGEPIVRNGLALCNIHYAAYDAGILGVSPEYRAEIRADLLLEIDDLLSRHGLQDRHGLHGLQLMVLPTARNERPDRDCLNIANRRFREAGKPSLYATRFPIG